MTEPVEHRLELGDDVNSLALQMREVYAEMTTPELKRLKKFLLSDCSRRRPDADYAIRVLAGIGMAYASAVMNVQDKYLTEASAVPEAG